MIPRAPSGGPPTIPIALAALFALLLGSSPASASITIAWDRSPAASVIGYRVYVGTTSGYYNQTFDVGNATSFSYDAPGQGPYYFAVAAYSAGPVIGPLSSEVSTMAATAPTSPVNGSNYWSSVWNLQSQPKAIQLSKPPVCWMPSAQDCSTVQTVARTDGVVSSLAATKDGRLFFIAGGRRVHVVTPGGLAPAPVLLADNPSTLLNQVALDRTFETTGLIWVSETETFPDGRREFSIVRYRIVQNQAGERAVVIPAIHLPESGDARFALDDTGFFVMVPARRDGISDPYSGKVLRFNADGTAPSSSPVAANGYERPTGAAMDTTTGRVWFSGVEQQPAPTVRYIDARSSTAQVIQVEVGLSLLIEAASGGRFLSVTPDGLVTRSTLVSSNLVANETLALTSGQRAVAVAEGPGGALYAAVQATASGSPTFAVVRISKIP